MSARKLRTGSNQGVSLSSQRKLSGRFVLRLCLSKELALCRSVPKPPLAPCCGFCFNPDVPKEDVCNPSQRQRSRPPFLESEPSLERAGFSRDAGAKRFASFGRCPNRNWQFQWKDGAGSTPALGRAESVPSKACQCLIRGVSSHAPFVRDVAIGRETTPDPRYKPPFSMTQATLLQQPRD